MQPQLWFGFGIDFNHSSNFYRRMSKDAHIPLKLVVYFISLYQTTCDHILEKLILIRTFTDGMAPSLSTTRIFRLMAPLTGIPSRPPMARCSLSWLILYPIHTSIVFKKWRGGGRLTPPPQSGEGQEKPSLNRVKEPIKWNPQHIGAWMLFVKCQIAIISRSRFYLSQKALFKL